MGFIKASDWDSRRGGINETRDRNDHRLGFAPSVLVVLPSRQQLKFKPNPLPLLHLGFKAVLGQRVGQQPVLGYA